MSYVLKEQDKSYVFKSPLQINSLIPDGASKCPWTKDLHKTQKAPHSKWNWKPNEAKVLPDILASVGNTPMIKLNKIPKTENVECEIYGKCEFMNPVGSMKDRMALRCVEDAERSGLLTPGATIIEPSSGNTGAALSWVAAVKGYKCIIVLPDDIATEKENLIKSFGGEVIRVSTTADATGADGFFGAVHRLHKAIPNSIILDQVMGTGTGGTLTGISRKFKEISPNTLIIGADPHGSYSAQPAELNITDVKFVEIEGIGHEILPTVCDKSQVDKWYKLYDKESLIMARRLIKEEGLLVGSSSGVLMAGALKAIKDYKLGKGKKVVVLFPDGTKNYLTKFVSDQWMEQRGFLSPVNVNNHWWWNVTATDIECKPLEKIPVTSTLADVLAVMNKLDVDYLPVVENGTLAGVAIRKTITNKLISLNKPRLEVKEHIERLYSKLSKNSTIGLVSRVLEKENYVVLLDSEGDKSIKILTSEDVLCFIESKKQ